MSPKISRFSNNVTAQGRSGWTWVGAWSLMIRAGRQSYRHSGIAAPATDGEQTAQVFSSGNIKQGFRDCEDQPAKTVWGGNGHWRQLECPRQTRQPEVSPPVHCAYRSLPRPSLSRRFTLGEADLEQGQTGHQLTQKGFFIPRDLSTGGQERPSTR